MSKANRLAAPDIHQSVNSGKSGKSLTLPVVMDDQAMKIMTILNDQFCIWNDLKRSTVVVLELVLKSLQSSDQVVFLP